jgi:DNA-directed RNA polymerase subunit M/transcription elongation factor TFIIS
MTLDLDTYVPNNSTRKFVFDKFYTLLQKNILDDYSEDYCKCLAINLEKGIFNYSIQNKPSKIIYWNNKIHPIYMSRFKHIYNNLDPNSYIQNKSLLEKMLKNDITVHNLCVNMKPEEIFPEIYESYYKAKHDEESVPVQELPDGMFKCWKCKSKKTTYYQMQIRSADESITTFVTCQNCHNRWKFN